MSKFLIIFFGYRMHLHSVVLHLELVVVESDVLHVRFSFPCIPDPGHHLLGDDSSTVLLPSMR